MATKIRAKWESGLTAVQLKRDPPVCQFGLPKTLIIYEDMTLSADVLMLIYNTLNIRIQVISPLNHGLLRTEWYIKSVSEMPHKHLKITGEDWYLYVNPCCHALNTYVSPIYRILSIRVSVFTKTSRPY